MSDNTSIQHIFFADRTSTFLLIRKWNRYIYKKIYIFTFSKRLRVRILHVPRNIAYRIQQMLGKNIGRDGSRSMEIAIACAVPTVRGVVHRMLLGLTLSRCTGATLPPYYGKSQQCRELAKARRTMI